MLNKQLKILIWGSGLWYLGEGMLGPLFAIFGKKIGGSILDISWAWAIYLIIIGILVIFIGDISDKASKEKLMVVGYGINAIFTFLYLAISKPIHLFFVQSGLGIAAALTIPTWMALYAKHNNKERSGLTWGIATGLNRIIAGIALLLGGLIVTYFSFNVLFITMGIIQTLATIYLSQIIKTQTITKRKKEP